MKNKSEEKTINQHYVPQMYLRRFGYGKVDKERISVLKIMNGEILHSQNPRNFSSKRFFYDAPREDIEKALEFDLKSFPSLKEHELLDDIQFAEHALSRGESEYKKVLDLLEQDMFKIYDDSIRAVFIIFIHELAYRTASYRDKLDSINTKMEAQLNDFCDIMQISDTDRKQALEHNCVSGKDIQLEKILSLKEIYNTKDKLINNYNWYIAINNTELDFAISDNPAQTIWMGFNDICVPISNKKAFILRVKDSDAQMISNDKPIENIINLSQRSVILYNLIQISMADLYLFGSKAIINYMKTINDLHRKGIKHDN